jgi:hypothetical protein
MCTDGNCKQVLCLLKDPDFKSADDAFGPYEYSKDPTIGKLVKIDLFGIISFLDQDGSENHLDLNWRCLRNLARPIVDEQLAKLARAGDWKTNRVRLNLGTLMLDNRIVRFDTASYKEMKKDNTNMDVEDMEACCKS